MNIDKNEFRKYAVGHCHAQSLYVDSYISKIENSIPMAMTPYITEERELRVAQMDVFSRLMMDRIIFLGAAVDDNIANIIQAQLLFLMSFPIAAARQLPQKWRTLIRCQMLELLQAARPFAARQALPSQTPQP